ncbi:transcriptional regulator [Streptosporangium pseudovulgare]|uniref:Transcriptional regulator n=2 Tax=Streptosporangiales TaxID=85012 RepID=A0ABQ2R941_9ACTN|nr:transcriptional regulator [Streptosporangium pseudovulgare]
MQFMTETEANCRAREILDRVGDKWSVVVLYQLSTGTMRFTELLRAIPGISQRMLTVTLRGLERDGLVRRTVHPVIPPHVDYDLTPLGETLREIVSALLDWTHEHLEEIGRARDSYDAGVPTG